MKTFATCYASLSLFCLSTLLAPNAQADVGFVINAGYDVGGTKLIDITFTDGSASSVKTNQGFRVGLGLSYLNKAENFETELVFSYKADDVTGSNGQVKFERFPIDWLAFYRHASVRVGGGLSYHHSPALRGSGVVDWVDIDYKNALGYVVQVDYLFKSAKPGGAGNYAGIRYVGMDYESKKGGHSVSADGFGIHAGVRF